MDGHSEEVDRAVIGDVQCAAQLYQNANPNGANGGIFNKKFAFIFEASFAQEENARSIARAPAAATSIEGACIHASDR
jgi:hypothetical protein